MSIDLMPGFGAFTPAVSGGSTATWDPANKKAAIVLSNGNLTAFGNNVGDDQGVYATGTQTSGKFYFEYINDAQFSGSDGNGIAISTNGTLAYNNANGVNGVHYNTKSGTTKLNSSTGPTIDTVLATERGHCAIDIDNLKVWFRTQGGDWNNSGSDDPATNTGGLALVSGSNFYIYCYIPTEGQITIVFASTEWAGSAPSGFAEWP